MFRSLLLALPIAVIGTTASAQVLVTTNATSDTLISFDPFDGSLINANVFAIDNTVCVAAIEVNGEIWISQQTGDRLKRYDSAGTLLGEVGPTFTGGGLDNIRGMTLINGLIHVTNDGANNGATADSIVRFDTSGNWVDTLPLAGTSPSPYSVILHQGELLVASSSAGDDIHRYTTAGVSIGTFHDTTSLSFCHQIAPASDGNVWVANFTTGGIAKLDGTTGALISTFPASGARGVFELGNGNIMWTNGTGAHVYDTTTQTSTMVNAGSHYHLNVINGGPPPTNAFCFGDGTGTLCPCGNTGAAGRGCENGTNSGGGLLVDSGSTSIGSANFVLSGSGLQPNQPGLYFQGDNAINGGLGILNGDGLRCAGGSIRRLQVLAADVNGASATTANIAVAGAVNAGDTKRYQLWYRNPLNSPCGTTFNLTNGVEITWQP